MKPLSTGDHLWGPSAETLCGHFRRCTEAREHLMGLLSFRLYRYSVGSLDFNFLENKSVFH